MSSTAVRLFLAGKDKELRTAAVAALAEGGAKVLTANLAGRPVLTDAAVAYVLLPAGSLRAGSTCCAALIRLANEAARADVELIALDDGALDDPQIDPRLRSWGSMGIFSRVEPVLRSAPIAVKVPVGVVARDGGGEATPAASDLEDEPGGLLLWSHPTVGGTRGEATEARELRPDDLVRLTWDDGTEDWMTASAYAARFPGGEVRRDEGGGRDETSTLVNVSAQRIEVARAAAELERVLGPGPDGKPRSLRRILRGLDDGPGVAVLLDATVRLLVAYLEDAIAASREEKRRWRPPAPPIFDALDAPAPPTELDPAPTARRRPRTGRLYRVELPTAAPGAARLGDPHGLEGWAGKEVLLLLHGTFLPTEAGFADLLTGGPAGELGTRYGSRILAFQHRAWSASPIENAADLVAALREAGLPATCELVVLSHSRGGLLGEVFTAPIAALPPVPEGGARGRHGWTREDVEALTYLRSSGRPWPIRRFVRVAAPVRGTSLASERLDRLITILLGAIRGALLCASPALAAVLQVARLTCKIALKYIKRTDAVPGIAAMCPDSPLVGWLTQAAEAGAATDQQQLLAVTGASRLAPLDLSRLLQNACVLVTRGVFLSDNDTVVDTAHMSGGWRRAENSSRVLSFSYKELMHDTYFVPTQEAGKAILDGLTRLDSWPARAVDRGDGPADRGATGGLVGLSQLDEIVPPLPPCAGTKRRGVVILVPGVMGTRLDDERGPLWIDVGRLLAGEAPRLGWGQGAMELQTKGLLQAYYGGFADHLAAEGYEVVPFPYDWRAPIVESGELLRVRLREVLDRAGRGEPVHIAAHSMGGLVARHALAGDPEASELWRTITARGGRLLMAGTPNLGAPTLLRSLLTGDDCVLRVLNALMPRASTGRRRDLRELLREMPGVLDLLPTGTEHTAGASCRDAQWWERWWLEERLRPTADALREARMRCERLLASRELLRDPNLVYVAGVARETDVEIDADGEVLVGRWCGDGTVPYWSADVKHRWYVHAEHRRLFACERDHAALVELLARGHTTRLADVLRPGTGEIAIHRDMLDPPAASAAPRQPAPTPSRGRALPSRDLVEATLAGTTEGPPDAVPMAPPIRVSVLHGELGDASWPVVVGHHSGDPMRASERALDLRLGGRLSQLFGSEAYPHEVRTHLCVPGLAAGAAGALQGGGIIVGLGLPSALTPQDLGDTLRAAFVQSALQRRADRMGLSCLLIGSETALGVRESVAQIVRAAIEANDDMAHMSPPYALAEIEIVELYEDRALEARDALQGLVTHAFGVGRRSTVPELDWYVHRGGSGLSHHPLPLWRADSPHFIHISVSEATNALEFSLLSERARVEHLVHRVHWPTITELVTLELQGVKHGELGARGVGHLLFHQCLPQELRERLRVSRPIRLSLDDKAARIPWELMHDRDSDRPPVTRFILTRQLEVDTYRATPRDVHANTVLILADLERDAPLPGAEAEAGRVEQLFRAAGWEVDKLVGHEHTATDVRARLTPPLTRVLHIAAHGTLLSDPTGQQGTTPVIALPGGRDREKQPINVLTAYEFAQLDPLPQLVFLNTCHSGRLRDGGALSAHAPGYAPDIASALIREGVRCVVVTGWKVHDGAAALFGEVFWGAMLEGLTFGEAALRARARTWLDWPEVDTFGAYQAYGDLNYRLVEPSSRDLPISSLRAALDHVEQAGHQLDQAEAAGSPRARDEAGEYADRLRRLGAQLLSDWASHPDLALAMGRAWFKDLRSPDAPLAALRWLQLASRGGRGIEAVDELLRVWTRLLKDRRELGSDASAWLARSSDGRAYRPLGQRRWRALSASLGVPWSEPSPAWLEATVWHPLRVRRIAVAIDKVLPSAERASLIKAFDAAARGQAHPPGG